MLWIFLAYLAVTLGLGLWRARATKTQSDFVLGGRRLPGWMLALSERATGESAWLLLGFSGLVYAQGLSAIWVGLGCLAGILTAWIGLARRFRKEAEAHDALTMPDYFSSKFPSQAAAIRLLSSLIIVFFFVFYVGAQFAGAGKVVYSTFGVDRKLGQVLSAGVILVYASLGGFVSVVAVDVLQSVLMILTLVVTPAVLLAKLWLSGGSLAAGLAAAGPDAASLVHGASGFAAGLIVFNNFAWFFGYLGGQPQLSARFMGMRDDASVRMGRNVAVGWSLAAYLGVVLTGLGALALYGPKVVSDQEMILPHVVMDLFPWYLAALLLAGAVAAMVSTAQSMLLVAGTSVSEDIYKGLVKRGRVSDRTVLTVSRVATLVTGLAGLALALKTKELVYSIVSYAWAGIGCSFSPAILLSFWWRRYSSLGLVATLVVGLVVTVVWIATGLERTITARAVTFFAALAAGVVASLVWPDRAERAGVR